MSVIKLVRSPLAWILVVTAVLHAVGIGWGLPGSDGWDNDGVAPRDFIPGLIATFTPGQFYTYPVVHLVILAVLTLPITGLAFLRAPGSSAALVVGEAIKVPYMTAIAYVARGLSLAMSLGIVVIVARLAEELRAFEHEHEHEGRVRRAGWCAAAFVGVNVTLSYYGHTSNLDVPYLFWASWSLLLFTRAMTRRTPRLLRRALLLAVLSVGTKDQAYALFLLSMPIAWIVWSMRDTWAREHRATVARETATAVAMAVGAFAIVSGALFNPSGFRARVAFLTGSASQDYAHYANDWAGRGRILLDAARSFPMQYPTLLAVFIVLGLGLSLGRAFRASSSKSARIAVAALPLLAVVSFTVAFNWTARRTDARFLLPQAIMLAVYGGLGMEALVFAQRRAILIGGQLLASIGLAIGIYRCAALDVNFMLDARYDLEAWLRANVRPGDTIETYGLNVYMPRWPEGVRVIRVGPEPLDKRNPMPGVEEVQAPFEKADERDARWIVLSDAWVWRYLISPDESLEGVEGGRRLPATVYRTATDEAATRYFKTLVVSAGAFHLVHASKRREDLVPPIDVHGGLIRPMFVYERKTPR